MGGVRGVAHGIVGVGVYTPPTKGWGLGARFGVGLAGGRVLSYSLAGGWMSRQQPKVRKVVGRPKEAHPLDRVWELRRLAAELGLIPAEADDGELLRKVVGYPR